MPSKAYTSAGSTLSVSTDVPEEATLDNFDLLLYTKIGDVSDIGDFGEEKEILSYYEMRSNRQKKSVGKTSFGNMTFTMANIRDDNGQTVLQDIFRNGTEASFEVSVREPHFYYFTGIVTNYSVNIGGPDQIVSASITLELTSDVIVDEDIINI